MSFLLLVVMASNLVAMTSTYELLVTSSNGLQPNSDDLHLSASCY